MPSGSVGGDAVALTVPRRLTRPFHPLVGCFGGRAARVSLAW